MAKPIYQVTTPGPLFSGDRVVSTHKSPEAAMRAFNKVLGPCQLVRVCDGGRTVLESAMT